MKKSLLSVGAASMMLAMFATGCATGDNKMAEISNHFNNPPERYCIPVAGKEAEAAALDKKLAETDVTEIAALLKIVSERAVLLEGRCKRLNPSQYGAVCSANAVVIDGVGVVMEDSAFRSSSIGKAYIAVYDKSEALKIASQKLSEEGADAASVVASLPEDQVRDLASGTSAIFAVLDPKQTVVTLQNIASESAKSSAELGKVVPKLTNRIAELTNRVTDITGKYQKRSADLSAKIKSRSAELSKDLMSKGVNPFALAAEVAKIMTSDPIVVEINKELKNIEPALKAEIDPINAELNCLKEELKQAKILLEYGKYIGLSCGYMVQAINETNALSQAAKTALAKMENTAKNND